MTGTWHARIAGFFVAAFALGWAGAVLATTVLLIRPENPTATTAEALVRMHGELVSAGFDVQVLARTLDADARASLEAAAVDYHADAVVGLMGDPSTRGVEVWVIDKVTGKIVVRQVPSDSPKGRASEVLAIRSLELLRASFLEVAMTTDVESEKPPAPPLVKRYVSEAMDRRIGFTSSVEVGGGGEGGWGRVGLAVAPHVRVSQVLFRQAFVRLFLSGLGTRADVRFSEGAAQVWQEVGVLDVGYQWWPGMRTRPRLYLGAGLARITGQGIGDWPREGRVAKRWAGVLDGGVGLHIKVTGRLDIALELHVRFMEPYQAIRFFETSAATIGRPGLVLQVGLLSWI